MEECGASNALSFLQNYIKHNQQKTPPPPLPSFFHFQNVLLIFIWTPLSTVPDLPIQAHFVIVMYLDGIPMCSDLVEEIRRENLPRKDHLVSCVKCHKGTCNSLEALFVCQYCCKNYWMAIRIPGNFPSQDISCSLSDCVLPFSESMFSNALFKIFFGLYALCDVTEGPQHYDFQLTVHYPPPAWSPAHLLSSQSFSLMPLSKHVQSPTTGLNLNKRCHIVADWCIVAKGQMHNTVDMIDDKCVLFFVFLPLGSLFI